jgi:hypothetical protein
MGWWGFSVMEGDPPYDALSMIEHELGGELDLPDIGNDSDYDKAERKREKRIRKALKGAHYHKLIKKIKVEMTDDYDDKNIHLQVLGEMIMVNGGRMTERTKGTFRKAARCDEWSKENKDRKTAMETYIHRINKYKNKPIKATSKGLFATLSDHLASGATGLLNK